MNIGFDLDKVLIDYPPFVPAKLVDLLYKEKSNGILKYRIPSKPEQYLRLLTHLSILRPPITENITFILSPKINNSKYYLISSRFGFLKGRTQNLIQKYNFSSIFNGMFFNFENKQPHLFKNETIKKLGLDRYIDDDLPLLRFLSKKNPDTKFYWLNKNKTGKINKNLFAVTEISGILR